MEKFKLSRMQAIGLFVLITLLATFAVVNFLRGEDLFNKSTKYYATFSSVDGLTVTGPIYLRGLKVGMVEAIEYNMENDNFEVEFKVNSKFRIPADSKAEIYSADLLGSMAMRISMGKEKVYAQAGDTLATAIVPDMVSSITSQIAPIAEQAVVLMESMNRTLASVNQLLDSNARGNLQGTFAGLNKTMSNAAKLSGELNGMAPQLNEAVASLNLLAEALGKSAGDIQGTMANVNAITSQLSQADLDKVVKSLNGLLEKLQDPDGSVGKMLSTDALHNDIDALIKDVDNLVKCITENPKKYIKVSVF